MRNVSDKTPSGRETSGATAFRLAATIFAIVVAINARSDVSIVDQLEGYYTAPAKYCSEREGNRLVPCDHPKVEDCLILKRIDSRHMWFSVNSAQSNGASCSVDGVAVADTHGLTYTDNDPGDGQDFHNVLSIFVKHRAIRFKSANASDRESFAPFCGAHASLDGLEFSLKDRHPINARTSCGS